jgi:hypothetical protein
MSDPHTAATMNLMGRGGPVALRRLPSSYRVTGVRAMRMT